MPTQTCYQAPCAPGMMCIQGCLPSPMTFSREEILAEYEARMANFMADLKELYMTAVQAQADLALYIFKLSAVDAQLADANARISTGELPPPDYLNLIQAKQDLKNKIDSQKVLIADSQAQLEEQGSGISYYLSDMQTKLDMFAIPTATYEQVMAVIKSEVDPLSTKYTSEVPGYYQDGSIDKYKLSIHEAISLPPDPDEQDISLDDLNSQIRTLAPEAAKSKMPLLVGAAAILLFVMRRK